MGRLLDRLVQGTSAYTVRRETDILTQVGKPDRLEEFNDLVREAADHSGDDYVVFTTSDGHHSYSQMFVMPFDETSR
jgi:hypothetical protein